MEKGKLMMIIIIALLVLLLGAVGAVSFYVLGLVRDQQTLADATNTSPQVAKNLPIIETESIHLAEIVTNLADSPDGKKHFIRINSWVAYDNTDTKAGDAFAEMFDQYSHIAKSIALACVRGSTFEELSDPDGISNLADKIKQRLREEFESNLIYAVYLDEYLLQ